MNKIPAGLLLACVLLSFGQAQSQPGLPKRLRLPNGWYLTPAGRSIPLSSDLPLNMALSPDGNYAAITNNGDGRQTIDLFDIRKGTLVQVMDIGRAWLGLCFDRVRPFLYASGGNDNLILRYPWTGSRLGPPDTIKLGEPWPKEKIGVAGLAVDGRRRLLYAVTRENNSLYICDLATGGPIRHVPLSTQAYTCVLDSTGKLLYISGWGGAKVWVYNTEQNRLEDSIATGDNPNELVLSPDGRRLFVAEANANAVSVIDVRTRKVTETLHAALYPESLIGSTTNSLALTPDGRRLYVANADNNCLAVFDVSRSGHSRSEGFIPTGWYPTSVRVLNHRILVLNGKGLSSFANAQHQYIGALFKGSLLDIPDPTSKDLGYYTQEVYRNTPYSRAKEATADGVTGNPIPRRRGESSPIQYVFYIIKENRSYDQVLGDMSQGRGDTSLCLFGERVTPNAHALAAQYVLLDNFYVDGEVSVDGHCWSTSAYATDYVEKSWPSDYSRRGGTDDFDGAGQVANTPKGFIWDYCRRAGISFRNYGEMLDNTNNKLKVFEDSSTWCPYYPTWDLGIRDVYREQQFERDFDSLVSAGAMRHLNTLYLPNDHTHGDDPDSLTPTAYIADNDLALGRLVDHISHSPIWPRTAIFVLEDDAQGGPDHIDAHRSTAFVISPYVRPHSVDHTPYSTSGMLRTIELLVGLPPMSQYDAAATPMYNSFQRIPAGQPFSARLPLADLNERNGSRDSAHTVRDAAFDFSGPDRSPANLLNEAIWRTVKGANHPMPAPSRSAFVRPHQEEDDDQ